MWHRRPVPPELAPIQVNDTRITLEPLALSGVTRLEKPTRVLWSLEPTIALHERAPSIELQEGSAPVARYRLDPTAAVPDLTGWTLHASVRVLDSFAVMMDGLLTPTPVPPEPASRSACKGVRFQPLFLRRQDRIPLEGQGLFARGLHFSGKITPSNVRLCCVCDSCAEPFTLQSFHAGFGDNFGLGQYFYCERGIHTLGVDTHALEGCPRQLAPEIDLEQLRSVEARLPPCAECGTAFRYYHPLRCPHCAAPVIDFERFPAMRPGEYYGNKLAGGTLQRMRAL